MVGILDSAVIVLSLALVVGAVLRAAGKKQTDTEYFLAFGGERRQFAGINYCPFCGRVLSRELWNLEKKK